MLRVASPRWGSLPFAWSWAAANSESVNQLTRADLPSPVSQSDSRLGVVQGRSDGSKWAEGVWGHASYLRMFGRHEISCLRMSVKKQGCVKMEFITFHGTT